MLTRLLTAKDDRFSVADAPHRALLSYRLGHARSQRATRARPCSVREGDLGRAASDGATLARRALVDLARADGDPARKEQIATYLAAIVHATGAMPDLVAWGDELRRQNRTDAARTALEVAVACGHQPDVHQLAFLQGNKPFAMRDDENYKAALEAAERAMVSGEDQPLAQVASTSSSRRRR